MEKQTAIQNENEHEPEWDPVFLSLLEWCVEIAAEAKERERQEQQPAR